MPWPTRGLGGSSRTFGRREEPRCSSQVTLQVWGGPWGTSRHTHRGGTCVKPLTQPQPSGTGWVRRGSPLAYFKSSANQLDSSYGRGLRDQISLLSRVTLRTPGRADPCTQVCTLISETQRWSPSPAIKEAPR